MSTKFPSKKGFAGHATRCVDPAFGFCTALVYLCKYLILSPNQIVAGALVIRFWNAEINSCPLTASASSGSVRWNSGL
jgi:amino acid transporter